MTDLASLGLEVRSDQIEKGARSLEKLTGAAQRAEAASEGLSSSSTRNAGAIAREGSAAVKAAAQVEALGRASRRGAVAVNDNIHRMGGSFSGLAAQAQDVGVTAAMGMNPLIIGLQQGTQIAGQMEMALKDGGSAAGVFGQAIRSLLSPVSIISIGLTVLAAAALQMIDWGGALSSVLNGLADVIQTIGPYAIAAAAALALIYAPAIIGGVGTLIGLMGSLSLAALRAAASFTTAWLAAIGPAGWFILGLAAIVTAANIFRRELAQIFGVDVVGAAKDGANAVIGAFVGAYNYVVTSWAHLPDVFSGLAKKAVNSILDEFSKPWLAVNGKTLIPGFDTSGLKRQLSDDETSALAGATGTIGNAMGQDYLGAIGKKTTVYVSDAVAKLKELAGLAGHLGDGTSKKHHKTEAERLADRYDRITQSAENYIATQNAEQQAIGMTDLAAAKLTHTQDLLNKAKQAGIDLTPQQTAELTKLGGAMGAAEIATKKAKEAFDFAKGATKGFLSDFTSAIEQGKNLWQAFGDAASSVLDKIIGKIEDNLVDALFSAKNAASGGGGGFLGTIFSGIGSLFGGGGDPWAGLRTVASAKGNVFDGPGISAYSSSVVNRPTLFPFARGVGLMGEAGPEAIMPLRRGPDGRLGVAAAANQNGGTQHVTINVNVEGANGDQHVIDLVQQGVASGLGAYRKSQTFTQDVARGSADAKSQRFIRRGG